VTFTKFFVSLPGEGEKRKMGGKEEEGIEQKRERKRGGKKEGSTLPFHPPPPNSNYSIEGKGKRERL